MHGSVSGSLCAVWPDDDHPYDPTAPAELLDPYQGWARAREEAPVFYSPQHKVWFVMKWQDVAMILRDPDTFSSAHAFDTPPPPADLAQRFPTGLTWEHTIASADPPDHSRLRQFAQRALTPKLVADREPDIRALANSLLDEFPREGEVDLVKAYSEPLPLMLITRLVGAPDEDIPKWRRWTDSNFRLMGSTATSALSPTEFQALYEDAADLVDYCRAFIDERRRAPRDDLASRLIHDRAEDGSPCLSEAELVGVIASLFRAGNETTASLIAKSVYTLLLTDRWSEVVAEPALLPRAIEETMRFLSPVTVAQRTARREAMVGGVDIPAGAQLILYLGSADRDGDIFSDPDTFNPGRDGLGNHLGFGRGIHFCVGAPLARLEARIALEELSRRYPHLTLASGEAITYHQMYMVHSPASLRVEI